MVAIAEHKLVLSSIKKVVVIMIKPAGYDEDGFTFRFGRAVLPSNSTAVLNTLTREALESVLPSHVPREIHMLEDGIASHAQRLKRLIKRFPEKETKLIVCLVAVQTAQFNRACDLMDRWQAVGATCVIGGFHVSGSISTLLDGVEDRRRPDIPSPHRMPPEIQSVMDKGVIVFHGEAEEVWRQALADILSGQPKQLYRGGRPNLQTAPLPEFDDLYFQDCFATRILTCDSGRGCPFICSFCTIINVQGRENRYRDPAAIITLVKNACIKFGHASFFITDDNFGRNPLWEQILDGLIALRAGGCKIGFMVEADLACGKIPRFLEKLAAAGCSQIFMGVESMNPLNLTAAGKPQNRVAEYEQLWRRCHDLGVMIHSAYIVGFQHDTPTSVLEDVRQLMEKGADQVSLFILTPLPGSEDHVRMIISGQSMDAELWRYDSFRPVMDHPLMSRTEWLATYQAAWRQVYTVANMVRALKRCQIPHLRLSLLRNYVWYRWSALVEETHPMISGFRRYRDWDDRRPGSPALSLPKHLVLEFGRHVRYFALFLREFFIFQHVVFEVECAPALAERRTQLADRAHTVADWFRLTFGRHVSRRWLNTFWINYGRQRWNLLWNPLPHVQMLPHAFSEVIYAMRFASMVPSMLKSATK